MRDYRDLTIEALADSEAELLDRIVDLKADVAAYREVAVAGIKALRFMTLERDRLRDRLYQLGEELRALRSNQQRAA